MNPHTFYDESKRFSEYGIGIRVVSDSMRFHRVLPIIRRDLSRIRLGYRFAGGYRDQESSSHLLFVVSVKKLFEMFTHKVI